MGGAYVRQGTLLTARSTRRADITSEKHDAVAKIRLLGRLDDGAQYFLDLIGIFQRLRIEAEPSADTNAVGIGDDRRAVIEIADKKIGDFSTDAGQGKQLLNGVG